MTTIQIKNVPPETHAVLRARAASARQSLQEYLLGHLVDIAARPTLGEVLDRMGAHAGGSVSFDDAVAEVRAERAGH